MIASNRASYVYTLSRRLTCSLWKLISSSRNLRIIPKIRLKCILFKPWKLAWPARSAGMLDIWVIIAQKSKKKRYILTATTMGFIHKEVRGGINHTHITKEVKGIQILSVLSSLPWEILSTAKRRSVSPFRRSWLLQTNLWRPSMPRWTDSPLLWRTSWVSIRR